MTFSLIQQEWDSKIEAYLDEVEFIYNIDAEEEAAMEKAKKTPREESSVTFEDYLIQVDATEGTGARRGQRAYNLLSLYKPRIADRIRSSEVDPFFDDSVLDAFFAVVYAEWGQ